MGVVGGRSGMGSGERVWGLAGSAVPGRAGAGAVVFGRDEKTELAIGFVVLVLLGAV